MSYYFTRIIEEEAKKEKEQIDTVIKLSRQAITYFRKKKYKNIDVEISIRNISSDPNLGITVYNKKSNNVSFYFYSFTKSHDNEKAYNNAIDIIKSDNFNTIYEYKYNKK